MATEKPEDLAAIRDLAASGALRATIDQRLPFARIARAHALVDSGRKRGAVVVEVDPAAGAIPVRAS